MNSRLIISILKYYGIRHTREYVEKLSHENIYGDNLFGVLRHLSFYGINAEAARLSSRDDYMTIPLPAIVQTVDREFLLVTSINDGKFAVTRGDKHDVLTLDQLDQYTTGIVAMLSCKTPRDEQNYTRHRIDQWWHRLSRWMAIPFIVMVVCKLLWVHIDYTSPSYLLMLLLCFTGLAVCFLLHRQWTGNGNAVEKVCGWLPASNCSSAHESFVFNRWFDLSEIGGSYFATMLVILLACNNDESSLWGTFLIITTLPLPFTVWSIWWQFVRQKTWCPLCVCIQLLLWMIATVCWCHCVTSQTNLITCNMRGLAIFCIVWMAIFSLIQNVLTALSMNATKRNTAESRLAHLKGQRQVFDALWGIHISPGEDIKIEIAVSPTCGHCRKAEEELELMQQLQPGRYTVIKHWYPIHPGDEELIAKVVDEAQASADLEWCNAHDIHSTPVIYVNGTLLPKQYAIKDLKFL